MDKIKLVNENNDGYQRRIRLKDNRELELVIEDEGCNVITVNFYEDEEKENSLGGEFVFEDVNYDEENFSTSQRWKLYRMFAPTGYERMGIGEYILRWIIDIYEQEDIVVSNPFDVEIKDGSEITGDGLPFVLAMQEKGLIHDPDKYDD